MNKSLDLSQRKFIIQPTIQTNTSKNVIRNKKNSEDLLLVGSPKNNNSSKNVKKLDQKAEEIFNIIFDKNDK